jgi:hypothetical protein
MANLFRRIYDWLLRLFWYAYLSALSKVTCARLACLMRHLMPLARPVFAHQETQRDGRR